MKKLVLILGIAAALVLSSCSSMKPTPRSTAYKGMYKEKPVSILIMPPINKTTNVECKEYFQTTLLAPLANAGYYVVPPFLSMEILKKESAYDSELFLNQPLTKFGEVFGADVALFTIIHKWDKSGLAATVTVDIEYIFKSISTGNVLYTRRGTVVYDSSVQTQGGGLGSLVASVALSAAKTALTNYMPIARACNGYTLTDIPAGKYSTEFEKDGAKPAGAKNFKVTISPNSRY
jgi:hypothetical protein